MGAVASAAAMTQLIADTITHVIKEADLPNHRCDPSKSWWENDAQNIPLCRVCDVCRDAKLAGYRPEILTGYSQADVEEPIEPQE
jgi:hypothetical protein